MTCFNEDGISMAGSAKKGGERPHAATKPPRVHLAAGSPKAPTLDRVVQGQIGDKLRSMYGELIEQPVPDRLADLLRQLDQDTNS